MEILCSLDTDSPFVCCNILNVCMRLVSESFENKVGTLLLFALDIFPKNKGHSLTSSQSSYQNQEVPY